MKNISNSSFYVHLAQKLLWQLLGCIIPTLMGVVASFTTVKEWILTNSPNWLKTCLTTGWCQILLIILGAIVIPSIVYCTIEYIGYRKKKTGYEILLHLMSNIGKVVEKKRHRFRDIRNCHLKSDATIFRKITKPDEQIPQLCQALCLMMQFMTNNEDVKSTLFHCKKGEIIETMAVCGEDELKAQLCDLNKHSLAKHVLVTGKPVLVNDTDGEENFYKPMGCKTKAIYIHPIYEGNEILFILSFSSQQKDVFNKKHMKKYEVIIEEFSNRIMLEWHLRALLRQNKNG